MARAQARLNDLLAGSRAQEIEQARSAVRSASATREWTERDYQRARELFGKELVAVQEVDRAQQAWAVAVANERSARERLSMLEAGAREQEIAPARADLKAAGDRLSLLQAGPGRTPSWPPGPASPRPAPRSRSPGAGSARGASPRRWPGSCCGRTSRPARSPAPAWPSSRSWIRPICGCATLGFIYQGRLIAQGGPSHIKTEAFRRTVVEVETDALRRAADALAEHVEIEEVVRVGARLIMVDGFGSDDVRAFLAADGLTANWVQEVEPSVEDLFVSFVDKERKARLREQLRAL